MKYESKTKCKRDQSTLIFNCLPVLKANGWLRTSGRRPSDCLPQVSLELLEYKLTKSRNQLSVALAQFHKTTHFLGTPSGKAKLTPLFFSQLSIFRLQK